VGDRVSADTIHRLTSVHRGRNPETTTSQTPSLTDDHPTPATTTAAAADGRVVDDDDVVSIDSILGMSILVPYWMAVASLRILMW